MLTFWIGLIFLSFFLIFVFLTLFWEVPSDLFYSQYTCMCMCVFLLCYHGFNFSKASLFICYLNVPSSLFWPPYFSLASSCFRCFCLFVFVFASRLSLNIWRSCLLIFKSEVLKSRLKIQLFVQGQNL